MEENKQHVQVPNMDLGKEGLSLHDPYIYACIKRYMNNETKVAFPSIDKLVKDSKLTKKTVKASIDRLHKSGYISIIKEIGKVNHYKFNDYKKFEIFSYDFLDDPNYNSKEKSYLAATQANMIKDPITKQGYISYTNQELADKLNISLNTLKKIEKSLQFKGALTMTQIRTKDPLTGLRNFERIYSFEEFSNLIALKFISQDKKIENHEERLIKLEDQLQSVLKTNELLMKENKQLKKEMEETKTEDIIL